MYREDDTYSSSTRRVRETDYESEHAHNDRRSSRRVRSRDSPDDSRGAGGSSRRHRDRETRDEERRSSRRRDRDSDNDAERHSSRRRRRRSRSAERDAKRARRSRSRNNPPNAPRNATARVNAIETTAVNAIRGDAAQRAHVTEGNAIGRERGKKRRTRNTDAGIDGRRETEEWRNITGT